MKHIAILLCLCLPSSVLGQATVKKKIKNEYPAYEEVFYVLKENPEIKHGPYQKTMRGFKAKGQYHENKRTGTWEFIGRNGQVAQRIEFPEGIIANIERERQTRDMRILSELPDEKPVLIGGIDFLMSHLVNSLRYPANARRRGVQGTVWISATITANGRMIDEKVEEGPGHGLNEEALRVIQMLPDDWLPGRTNGQPVDVRIAIPIKFKLA